VVPQLVSKKILELFYLKVENLILCYKYFKEKVIAEFFFGER
jgi:hypothetical protein